MAKAREIPELGEDDQFAAAAAKVVSVRTRELADSVAGVLDPEDIERVHDMRVATRRLRAALEVFEPCFPKRRCRTALKEVKSLADALGERRDRDVTIAALTEFEAGVAAVDRPGVRSLVDRLCEEQAKANVALGPHVTAERIGALCGRLDELVAEAEGLVAEPEPAVEDSVVPVDTSASGSMSAPEPAPMTTNGGEPR